MHQSISYASINCYINPPPPIILKHDSILLHLKNVLFIKKYSTGIVCGSLLWPKMLGFGIIPVNIGFVMNS